MTNKPMYVGEQKFASVKEAKQYCLDNNLSMTLVHNTPLKLKKKNGN